MDNILETRIKANNERWKYRRKIAFISLSALLFLPHLRLLLGVMFPNKLEALKTCDVILATAIPSYTSIVLAYFGLATWDDKVHKNNNNNKNN